VHGLSNEHQPMFYSAPKFLKMGMNYLNVSSFWTISTLKDEKSAAKFHYTRNPAIAEGPRDAGVPVEIW